MSKNIILVKELLVKKVYAERTITHLCGVTEHKNILAETGNRFQKYTHKDIKIKILKEHIPITVCRHSLNFQINRREYMLQKKKI
jgi:hypothetical protein